MKKPDIEKLKKLILLYLYACGSRGSRSFQHLSAAIYFINKALEGDSE